MTDIAQPSSSAEEPLTPPIILDSITIENSPSGNNLDPDSSESEPEIESDEYEEGEPSNDWGGWWKVDLMGLV
jgi:hypothetical protein